MPGRPTRAIAHRRSGAREDAARATKIATLRVIGFSGFSAFMGTMCEALVLSTVGALLGTAVCGLLFNGLSA
ncbi:MAG: hypothetical protein IM624_08970, partial [Phenylobacterium sp.]|uniref:hypothetical protein n=1 Tax=Phenylobacterium sp. TaxID=1871053 RepID=UPI0025EEC085